MEVARNQLHRKQTRGPEPDYDPAPSYAPMNGTRREQESDCAQGRQCCDLNVAREALCSGNDGCDHKAPAAAQSDIANRPPEYPWRPRGRLLHGEMGAVCEQKSTKSESNAAQQCCTPVQGAGAQHAIHSQ